MPAPVLVLDPVLALGVPHQRQPIVEALILDLLPAQLARVLLPFANLSARTKGGRRAIGCDFVAILRRWCCFRTLRNSGGNAQALQVTRTGSSIGPQYIL